jgi:HEAT repeat protein
MPMSMSELRRQLSAIEADESMYEGIGPSEVPLLQELLGDEEAWLAARAAHALSRIDDESARAAVRSAAHSARPEVREAIAASADRMPPDVSNEVLSALLRDTDVAVRKFAIKATSNRNSDAIRERIGEIATSDTDTALRNIAEQKTRSIQPP